MAREIPNQFSSWEFESESEALTSKILTDSQKKNLCNERALSAQALINLKLDPSQVNEYTQQQAYLQSRVEFISFLLAESDNAEEALIENSRRGSE